MSGQWYWEVTYKTKCGTNEALRSEHGFPSRLEAFVEYVSNMETITKLLHKYNCTLIIQEQTVFDNDRIMGG